MIGRPDCITEHIENSVKPTIVLETIDATNIKVGEYKVEIPVAYAAIKNSIHTDEDYAWSWHCNIAMAIYDSDFSENRVIKSKKANIAAANVLLAMFGYDIKNYDKYLDCIN